MANGENERAGKRRHPVQFLGIEGRIELPPYCLMYDRRYQVIVTSLVLFRNITSGNASNTIGWLIFRTKKDDPSMNKSTLGHRMQWMMSGKIPTHRRKLTKISIVTNVTSPAPIGIFDRWVGLPYVPHTMGVLFSRRTCNNPPTVMILVM